MKTGKAPTIKDVAAVVGLSPYTVSAVLNGARSNTRVSSETRTRILAAAAELGYCANAMARGLARRRTDTLGVLFGVVRVEDVLISPYASDVLQGILLGAAEEGFGLHLFTSAWKDASSSAMAFRDGRADGVIVVAAHIDSDVVPGLGALRLPLVAISSEPHPGVPMVDVDNREGVRLAVEHLLSLGHRRIAHITGNLRVYSACVRRDAFAAVMAQHGVPVPCALMGEADYGAAGVPEIVTRMLALPEPPTAIFAANDSIAVAALETARRLGWSVPLDLSVVGFDDIPAAALVTPALTTVRQPVTEVGRMAVSELCRLLRGEGGAGTPHLLAPELVVRATTAPPRGCER